MVEISSQERTRFQLTKDYSEALFFKPCELFVYIVKRFTILLEQQLCIDLCNKIQ